MSPNDDIIYDHPPVFDEYGDNEWYLWFGSDSSPYGENINEQAYVPIREIPKNAFMFVHVCAVSGKLASRIRSSLDHRDFWICDPRLIDARSDRWDFRPDYSTGGCGACNVLLFKFDSDHKQVEDCGVSSCLTLLCSVNGYCVTTVERTVNRKDGFHFVHQRIAGFHASQCGFCTPGICVSLLSPLLKAEITHPLEPALVPPAINPLPVHPQERLRPNTLPSSALTRKGATKMVATTEISYQMRDVRFSAFDEYPPGSNQRGGNPPYKKWLKPPPLLSYLQVHSKSSSVKENDDENYKIFGVPLTVIINASDVHQGLQSGKYLLLDSGPRPEQSKCMKVVDKFTTPKEQDKEYKKLQPLVRYGQAKVQGVSTRSCTKVIGWSLTVSKLIHKEAMVDLKQQGDSPFKIVKCIGSDAYDVVLSGRFGVSATFKVKDSSPYLGENELNSRSSSFQPGENDTGQSGSLSV